MPDLCLSRLFVASKMDSYKNIALLFLCALFGPSETGQVPKTCNLETTDKCSICNGDDNDLKTRLSEVKTRYQLHKNNDTITEEFRDLKSCYDGGYHHDLHKGCSIRNPCPNSLVSILPPRTENDWCYLDIYAPKENFEEPNNTEPEARLYLKGDRTTCSNTQKWALDEKKKGGLFQYRIQRNRGGEGISRNKIKEKKSMHK